MNVTKEHILKYLSEKKDIKESDQKILITKLSDIIKKTTTFNTLYKTPGSYEHVFKDVSSYIQEAEKKLADQAQATENAQKEAEKKLADQAQATENTQKEAKKKLADQVQAIENAQKEVQELKKSVSSWKKMVAAASAVALTALIASAGLYAGQSMQAPQGVIEWHNNATPPVCPEPIMPCIPSFEYVPVPKVEIQEKNVTTEIILPQTCHLLDENAWSTLERETSNQKGTIQQQADTIQSLSDQVLSLNTTVTQLTGNLTQCSNEKAELEKRPVSCPATKEEELKQAQQQQLTAMEKVLQQLKEKIQELEKRPESCLKESNPCNTQNLEEEIEGLQKKIMQLEAEKQNLQNMVSGIHGFLVGVGNKVNSVIWNLL